MRNPYRRYQEDPFFRSIINVVFIQTTLVLATIIVFAVAIQHQKIAASSTIQMQQHDIAAGQGRSTESLNSSIEDTRDHTLGVAFGVLITLAIIFGYIAARYALVPTRMSLEYQKRFIGNIAHELRTPLAIIRTNTEVALMDKSLNDYTRSTFETTIGELDRVSGIMNNLLSFDSLMRPGRIRLDVVDLRDVAAEVVTRHMQMARSYGTALALDAEDAPAYVMGNRIALEQVLTNLVKNALNYTPQHDKRNVVVRIDDTDEHIVASVIDTGIGIAQKDLYYIFQPYFRGDTSRERSIGSGTSGLGLAIVNDIVRAHNGSIIIRSALNRGTTIEIALPKATDAERSETSPAPQDDEEHEERIG